MDDKYENGSDRKSTIIIKRERKKKEEGEKRGGGGDESERQGIMEIKCNKETVRRTYRFAF